MKHAAFRCFLASLSFASLSFILTQPRPLMAAPAKPGPKPTTAIPSKPAPKPTLKTPLIAAPKPTPKPTPKAVDPFAKLTPFESGPGIVICEPTAPGNEEMANFGAGCARWLQLWVGGQGELGRTPPSNDIARMPSELKRADLRVSEADLPVLRRALGITHAVLGQMTAGEKSSISWQIWTLASTKNAPLGEAITASGTREEIVAALPETARKIALALGVKSPKVPDKIEVSPDEMALLGSVPREPSDALDDERQAQLVKLAPREPLAALLGLRFEKDLAALSRYIMRRASENLSALADLAHVSAIQLEPFSDQWEPVVKSFPHNQQAACILARAARWNEDDVALRRAAETGVRCAPENSYAWLRLSQAIEYLRPGKNGASAPTMEGQWTNYVNRLPLRQAATVRATTLDPLNGNAWYDLSRLKSEQDDGAGAEAAFWTALKVAPDDANVYALGIGLFESEDAGSAKLVKVARLGLAREKLWPQLAGSVFNAMRFLDLKQPDARSLMLTIIERALDTPNTPLQKSARLQSALLKAWEPTRQAPGDAAKWLAFADACEDGADALRQGRANSEISQGEQSLLDQVYALWWAAAQTAVNLNPKSGPALLAYGRAGSFSRIMTDYERQGTLQAALTLAPDNPDIYHWGLQVEQPKWGGDPELLWQLAQKAASKPKLFESLATDIAEALLTIHDRDAAKTSLLRKAQEKISELETREDPKIQHRIGAYFRTQGDLTRAVTAYKNWARLEPDKAEAHYLYGTVLHNSGQYPAALDQYREALRLNPDLTPALLYAGGILNYSGKPDEGEAMLRHAIEILPEWAPAYVEWGNALNLLKRRDEARAAWQKVIDMGEMPNTVNDNFRHAQKLLNENPAP